MKSYSVSLAVDEFATGSADSLILIGRILLAWVFVGSAYGAIVYAASNAANAKSPGVSGGGNTFGTVDWREQ